MRETAAAVAAIAASFNVDPIYGGRGGGRGGYRGGYSGGRSPGDPRGRGRGADLGSSKSNKSSNSTDCTYCSADTLTRATMVKNLFFGNLGDENGEITQASIADFCSEGPEATTAFIQAGNNAAGCLVHFECGFQNIVNFVYSGENIIVTEGLEQADLTNGLCYAEQNDVILPEGGCPDYIDPCETINNGGGGGLLGGPAEDPLFAWAYWQHPGINIT